MRSQSLVVTSRPFTLGDHSPPPTRIVRAFAPGGIGNLGPGLDILGCAVTGLGDTVDARFVEAPGIHLEDAGHPDLPTDPSRNAATIAASEVIRRASAVGDGRWAMGKPIGIAIRVGKGLPLSGGQGGSAASAVAGAVAVNALLGGQLGQLDVLASAFAAERTVSGRHIDNIAPAGSINSNVVDMSHYLRFHLGNGTYEGKKLVSSATLGVTKLRDRKDGGAS